MQVGGKLGTNKVKAKQLKTKNQRQVKEDL